MRRRFSLLCRKIFIVTVHVRNDINVVSGEHNVFAVNGDDGDIFVIKVEVVICVRADDFASAFHPNANFRSSRKIVLRPLT